MKYILGLKKITAVCMVFFVQLKGSQIVQFKNYPIIELSIKVDSTQVIDLHNVPEDDSKKGLSFGMNAYESEKYFRVLSAEYEQNADETQSYIKIQNWIKKAPALIQLQKSSEKILFPKYISERFINKVRAHQLLSYPMDIEYKKVIEGMEQAITQKIIVIYKIIGNIENTQNTGGEVPYISHNEEKKLPVYHDYIIDLIQLLSFIFNY